MTGPAPTPAPRRPGEAKGFWDVEVTLQPEDDRVDALFHALRSGTAVGYQWTDRQMRPWACRALVVAAEPYVSPIGKGWRFTLRPTGEPIDMRLSDTP